MQDRFLEDSLQFRMETLSYCAWGFRELKVDRDTLAAGQFSIADAEGIFPDGLLFDMPGADPAPPPRPLADHFTQDTEHLDVFLAVPNYRDKGANVSAPGVIGGETRYVAEMTMVRDEARSAPEKPVHVARKSLRFLFDGENRQGYSCLRVARIRKSAAGDLELDRGVVPPLLDFRNDDFLMMIARRLVETLGARSTDLASMRRHKNQSLADFTSADIASFWLLYTINAHFPRLRHLFEVKGGHPEELFREMLELAGALTTFSQEIHPRDLPSYDHDNLAVCFRDLDEKLRLLLETVVPKSYVSLALKQVRPSFYAASLADERFFTNTRMYLAIRADMDHGELIGRAPSLVKIASSNQVDVLVRQAVTGLGMVHTMRPPSTLPIKLHYEYFQLQMEGPYWESIVRTRNLAAYVPNDFPSAELELIILLPEAR
jgi:type VI secretion system protein ImpJ